MEAVGIILGRVAEGVPLRRGEGLKVPETVALRFAQVELEVELTEVVGCGG